MLTLPAASRWPQLCGAMENFLIPWVERRDTTERPGLAPRSSIKNPQPQPTVSQTAEEVLGRSSNVVLQLSVVRGLALAQWVSGGRGPVWRARRGCALGGAAGWPVSSQVTARGPAPGKEGGVRHASGSGWGGRLRARQVLGPLRTLSAGASRFPKCDRGALGRPTQSPILDRVLPPESGRGGGEASVGPPWASRRSPCLNKPDPSASQGSFWRGKEPQFMFTNLALSSFVVRIEGSSPGSGFWLLTSGTGVSISQSSLFSLWSGLRSSS